MSALAPYPSARRLGAALAGLARDVAGFALPQRCPACGAAASAATLLCGPCRERIPRLAHPLCARCLARERDPVGCRAHPGARVWPAFVYDERCALLVHALKYGGRTGLGAGLAAELARAAPARPRFGAVVAVPLHPARERERGYNQAACLAAPLADRLGVPWLPDLLVRTRPTAAQARLGARERRANLAGAFAVARPEWVAERDVLVVDDVVTTGATLDACFVALTAAGARPAGAALAWAA